MQRIVFEKKILFKEVPDEEYSFFYKKQPRVVGVK